MSENTGEKSLQNAKCIPDKGLVSQICRELLKLNSNIRKNPILKWAKDLNRHFTKKICKWKISILKDVQSQDLASSAGGWTSSPGSPGPQLHPPVSWHYLQGPLGFCSELLPDPALPSSSWYSLHKAGSGNQPT